MGTESPSWSWPWTASGCAQRSIFAIVAGLTVVVVSAHVVVGRAVSLAADWEVSESLIGVLLVGVGTSLPELALSVTAAARGRGGLSVGNVIGSNTFDLLVPVGASAAIYPLAVGHDSLLLDLPFLAVATLTALAFFLRHRRLGRGQAILLIAMYGAYVATRPAVAFR